MQRFVDNCEPDGRFVRYYRSGVDCEAYGEAYERSEARGRAGFSNRPHRAPYAVDEA